MWRDMKRLQQRSLCSVHVLHVVLGTCKPEEQPRILVPEELLQRAFIAASRVVRLPHRQVHRA